MRSYDIVMTDDAIRDLKDLRDYISEVLLVPDTALSYIRSIREEISKLAQMPDRIKPIDSEPWHSIGIRRILANNHYVYFRIDEEGGRVYVLNVIYDRRDQLLQLTNMNLDQ